MFADLFVNERLLMALNKLGFEQMTPVQEQAIPPAMLGQDLLVSAETGSGKTIAFLLPVLDRLLQKPAPNCSTRALILTPTRELARQVLKHCNDLLGFTKLKADVITGGADYKYQAALFRRNPEIIIATPGRLLEHLEKGTADLSDLEVLVLDEADRMLDMGFSEEVLAIASACRPTSQTLMYSATLKHQGIQRVASQILAEPQVITLSTHRDQHSAIKQQILLADDNAHKQRLLAWLLAHESYEKALIFANTKNRVDELGLFLQQHNLNVAVLHGDMKQDDRNKVMDRIRRGHVNVLVATDVAARGLDVKGIDLVINFEMARAGDDYVHRIGRTGRAGAQGLAISLIDHTEWNLMASIERYLCQSFERRTIKELKGRYTGPKKLKSGGQAAGSKKKKLDKKAAAKGSPNSRSKAAKPAGKRPAAAGKKREQPANDGFAPIMRKKAPQTDE